MDKFYELTGTVFKILQYSSQIIETEAIFLEFSPNFLHSFFTPLFSLKCAPLLPQCWATRILDHWDDCKTQVNILACEHEATLLAGYNNTKPLFRIAWHFWTNTKYSGEVSLIISVDIHRELTQCVRTWIFLSKTLRFHSMSKLYSRFYF